MPKGDADPVRLAYFPSILSKFIYVKNRNVVMKRSHYGTSGFQSFPNINANIKYGIKMKKNPMSVNVLGAIHKGTIFKLKLAIGLKMYL